MVGRTQPGQRLLCRRVQPGSAGGQDKRHCEAEEELPWGPCGGTSTPSLEALGGHPEPCLDVGATVPCASLSRCGFCLVSGEGREGETASPSCPLRGASRKERAASLPGGRTPFEPVSLGCVRPGTEANSRCRLVVFSPRRRQWGPCYRASERSRRPALSVKPGLPPSAASRSANDSAEDRPALWPPS